MRVAALVLGIVVAAVIVILGIALLVGTAKLRSKYEISQQTLALAIPSDAASVERGRHFVTAIAGCIDCHGADLGGSAFLDVPPFRIVAPNLTRGQGGVGTTFSDADFVRAIRHGVAPDGHALLVMPADDYTYLSDQDLADIIAYLRSLPAVDRQLPPSDVRPLGRLLLAANLLPLPPAATIDHNSRQPAQMPFQVSSGYGRYLAQVGGCTGCHGAGLSGGKIPGLPPDAPPAQNITPAAIGGWTEKDFVRALRVGKRPDGSTIAPLMPWRYFTRMTDGEIAALWLYIHSVPARPTGTR